MLEWLVVVGWEPVKRVHIEKPGSTEKRPFGIPTVRDRVMQTSWGRLSVP